MAQAVFCRSFDCSAKTSRKSHLTALGMPRVIQFCTRWTPPAAGSMPSLRARAVGPPKANMIWLSGCNAELRFFMGLLNAMCRALVNEPCNDTLFSCRTIQAMEKTTPLHESTARLYRVARDVMGDDAPAKVARRINVSAQTLQNWEGRGVSQDGALKR